MTASEIKFLTLMNREYGIDGEYPLSFTRKDITAVERKNSIKMPPELATKMLKVGARYSFPHQLWESAGLYMDNEVLPELNLYTTQETFAKNAFVPAIDPSFVRDQTFFDLMEIIESGVWYPTWIYGESGYGKTTLVEQACAALKRELVVVDIYPNTEESTLLGGWQLVDGNTKWVDGLVTVAMRRGAVLLLDEIDRASTKAMCLQPVLSGKTLYLPKIHEAIQRKPGFKVVATANTRGRGSSDGRYVGTNAINEAFLDRFESTLYQPPLTAEIEKAALLKRMEMYGINDPDWADDLVLWSSNTRQNFDNGVISENLSTRRVLSVIDGYAITKDKKKSLVRALRRFDEVTQSSLISYYDLVAKTTNSSLKIPTKPGTPKVW